MRGVMDARGLMEWKMSPDSPVPLWYLVPNPQKSMKGVLRHDADNSRGQRCRDP